MPSFLTNSTIDRSKSTVKHILLFFIFILSIINYNQCNGHGTQSVFTTYVDETDAVVFDDTEVDVYGDNYSDEYEEDATESIIGKVIHFKPSQLVFENAKVIIPSVEDVVIINHFSSDIEIYNITINDKQFQSVMYTPQILRPRESCVAPVAFLAYFDKISHAILRVFTSQGNFDYKIEGRATPNPYGLQPILGTKLRSNSLPKEQAISLYNPDSEPLQIREIFTTAEFLVLRGVPLKNHLQNKNVYLENTGSITLPALNEGSDNNVDDNGTDNKRQDTIGQQNKKADDSWCTDEGEVLWIVPPNTEKEIVILSIMTRSNPADYLGYVHIRTDQANMVLPVELQIIDGGVYTFPLSISFGVITFISERRSYDLWLMNSATENLLVQNIVTAEPDPQIDIHLSHDLIVYTGGPKAKSLVATITYTSSHPGQINNILLVFTNNSNAAIAVLEIPYSVTILRGGVGFDYQKAIFYVPIRNITKESPENCTQGMPMCSNSHTPSIASDEIKSSNQSLVNDGQYEMRNFTFANNFSVPISLQQVGIGTCSDLIAFERMPVERQVETKQIPKGNTSTSDAFMNHKVDGVEQEQPVVDETDDSDHPEMTSSPSSTTYPDLSYGSLDSNRVAQSMKKWKPIRLTFNTTKAKWYQRNMPGYLPKTCWMELYTNISSHRIPFHIVDGAIELVFMDAMMIEDNTIKYRAIQHDPYALSTGVPMPKYDDIHSVQPHVNTTNLQNTSEIMNKSKDKITRLKPKMNYSDEELRFLSNSDIYHISLGEISAVEPRQIRIAFANPNPIRVPISIGYSSHDMCMCSESSWPIRQYDEELQARQNIEAVKGWTPNAIRTQTNRCICSHSHTNRRKIGFNESSNNSTLSNKHPLTEQLDATPGQLNDISTEKAIEKTKSVKFSSKLPIHFDTIDLSDEYDDDDVYEVDYDDDYDYDLEIPDDHQAKKFQSLDNFAENVEYVSLGVHGVLDDLNEINQKDQWDQFIVPEHLPVDTVIEKSSNDGLNKHLRTSSLLVKSGYHTLFSIVMKDLVSMSDRLTSGDIQRDACGHNTSSTGECVNMNTSNRNCPIQRLQKNFPNSSKLTMECDELLMNMIGKERIARMDLQSSHQTLRLYFHFKPMLGKLHTDIDHDEVNNEGMFGLGHNSKLKLKTVSSFDKNLEEMSISIRNGSQWIVESDASNRTKIHNIDPAVNQSQWKVSISLNQSFYCNTLDSKPFYDPSDHTNLPLPYNLWTCAVHLIQINQPCFHVMNANTTVPLLNQTLKETGAKNTTISISEDTPTNSSEDDMCRTATVWNDKELVSLLHQQELFTQKGRSKEAEQSYNHKLLLKKKWHEYRKSGVTLQPLEVVQQNPVTYHVYKTMNNSVQLPMQFMPDIYTIDVPATKVNHISSIYFQVFNPFALPMRVKFQYDSSQNSILHPRSVDALPIMENFDNDKLPAEFIDSSTNFVSVCPERSSIDRKQFPSTQPTTFRRPSQLPTYLPRSFFPTLIPKATPTSSLFHYSAPAIPTKNLLQNVTSDGNVKMIVMDCDYDKQDPHYFRLSTVLGAWIITRLKTGLPIVSHRNQLFSDIGQDPNGPDKFNRIISDDVSSHHSTDSPIMINIPRDKEWIIQPGSFAKLGPIYHTPLLPTSASGDTGFFYIHNNFTGHDKIQLNVKSGYAAVYIQSVHSIRSKKNIRLARKSDELTRKSSVQKTAPPLITQHQDSGDWHINGLVINSFDDSFTLQLMNYGIVGVTITNTLENGQSFQCDSSSQKTFFDEIFHRLYPFFSLKSRKSSSLGCNLTPFHEISANHYVNFTLSDVVSSCRHPMIFQRDIELIFDYMTINQFPSVIFRTEDKSNQNQMKSSLKIKLHFQFSSQLVNYCELHQQTHMDVTTTLYCIILVAMLLLIIMNSYSKIIQGVGKIIGIISNLAQDIHSDDLNVDKKWKLINLNPTTTINVGIAGPRERYAHPVITPLNSSNAKRRTSISNLLIKDCPDLLDVPILSNTDMTLSQALLAIPQAVSSSHSILLQGRNEFTPTNQKRNKKTSVFFPPNQPNLPLHDSSNQSISHSISKVSPGRGLHSNRFKSVEKLLNSRARKNQSTQSPHSVNTVTVDQDAEKSIGGTIEDDGFVHLEPSDDIGNDSIRGIAIQPLIETLTAVASEGPLEKVLAVGREDSSSTISSIPQQKFDLNSLDQSASLDIVDAIGQPTVPTDLLSSDNKFIPVLSADKTGSKFDFPLIALPAKETEDFQKAPAPDAVLNSLSLRSIAATLDPSSNQLLKDTVQSLDYNDSPLFYYKNQLLNASDTDLSSTPPTPLYPPGISRIQQKSTEEWTQTKSGTTSSNLKIEAKLHADDNVLLAERSVLDYLGLSNPLPTPGSVTVHPSESLQIKSSLVNFGEVWRYNSSSNVSHDKHGMIQPSSSAGVNDISMPVTSRTELLPIGRPSSSIDSNISGQPSHSVPKIAPSETAYYPSFGLNSWSFGGLNLSEINSDAKNVDSAAGLGGFDSETFRGFQLDMDLFDEIETELKSETNFRSNIVNSESLLYPISSNKMIRPIDTLPSNAYPPLNSHPNLHDPSSLRSTERRNIVEDINPPYHLNSGTPTDSNYFYSSISSENHRMEGSRPESFLNTNQYSNGLGGRYTPLSGTNYPSYDTHHGPTGNLRSSQQPLYESDWNPNSSLIPPKPFGRDHSTGSIPPRYQPSSAENASSKSHQMGSDQTKPAIQSGFNAHYTTKAPPGLQINTHANHYYGTPSTEYNPRNATMTSTTNYEPYHAAVGGSSQEMDHGSMQHYQQPSVAHGVHSFQQPPLHYIQSSSSMEPSRGPTLPSPSTPFTSYQEVEATLPRTSSWQLSPNYSIKSSSPSNPQRDSLQYSNSSHSSRGLVGVVDMNRNNERYSFESDEADDDDRFYFDASNGSSYEVRGNNYPTATLHRNRPHYLPNTQNVTRSHDSYVHNSSGSISPYPPLYSDPALLHGSVPSRFHGHPTKPDKK